MEMTPSELAFGIIWSSWCVIVGLMLSWAWRVLTQRRREPPVRLTSESAQLRIREHRSWHARRRSALQEARCAALSSLRAPEARAALLPECPMSDIDGVISTHRGVAPYRRLLKPVAVVRQESRGEEVAVG